MEESPNDQVDHGVSVALQTDQNENTHGTDENHSQIVPDSEGLNETSRPHPLLNTQRLSLDLLPSGLRSGVNLQAGHDSHPQLQYQQGDHNFGPGQMDTSDILAYRNGRYIGRVHLKYSIDIQYLLTPPPTTLRLPTNLVLEAGQSMQSHTQDTVTSTSDMLPAPKRVKIVAQDAEPVPIKPASHYADAAEEPTGMTKEEDDSCLTCLRNNRKCKGTEIKMVREQKRCMSCANPGKNTSGRICYWTTPDKGVFTYEDAQRILAKTLGGRALKKNTRLGRIKRQQQSAAQVKSDPSPVSNGTSVGPESDSEDFNNEENSEADLAVDSNTGAATYIESDGELMSAVDSAYNSLYSTIADGLGVAEGDHSLASNLRVERAIFEALNRTGPHHDWVEGIDVQVTQAMWVRVDASIRALEAILGGSQTEEVGSDGEVQGQG